MAQFIFWNWQDDDSTKNLNHRSLGLHEPGRYRGFDAVSFAIPGGMVLRLEHTLTGVDCTKFDDPTFSVERRGVLLTKQGVVIHDNGALDFNINPNSSGNPRIDLIIAEHNYVDIPGASIVIYSVIQGTPSATPSAPSLGLNPQIKTIIGELYIPNGTTALTDPGVVYTPALPPAPSADPTIVRTFNTQEITGNKKFSGGTLEKMAEALWSSNTLNLQSSELNRFFLNAQGSSWYLAVTDIANPRAGAEGYRIRLTTYQKLMFQPGANMGTPGGKTLYVEPGEEVIIWDSWQLLGLNPAAHFWVVQKGGEANNSLPNKFREMQAFSQGTDFSLLSTGALALAKDGNSYEVTVSLGAQVQGLVHHEPSDFWIFTKPRYFAGSFLFVKFKTSPVNGDVTLVHNAVVASTAKKIITPSGSNVTVKDGSMCLFLEFRDRYELVSVLDTAVNHWTLKAQLDAFIASQQPEPWKVIGSVGTMANGQPIPAFGGTTTNNAPLTTERLRLRKSEQGYIELRGYIKTTGVYTIVPLWIVTTLPVGYRPPLNVIKSVLLKEVGGLNYYNAQVFVDSSTGVVLGATTENIPSPTDVEYDLDIRFDTV